MREVVWADKVICLGGTLSSALTVGLFEASGYSLCASSPTPPHCDNSITVFSVSERRRASGQSAVVEVR